MLFRSECAGRLLTKAVGLVLCSALALSITAGLQKARVGSALGFRRPLYRHDRHADSGVSQILEAPVLRTAWAQFARQATIRTCSTAREQKGRAAAVYCRMLWGWSAQVVGGAGVLVSWWVEGLEHPGGRWRLVSCVGVRAPCCVHQACSVI